MAFNLLVWLIILAGLAALTLLTWHYRAAIAVAVAPTRMIVCGLAAIACMAVVAMVSPVQLPVAVYKLALVLVAGYLGYWLDRWIFPYARPDGYLAREWRDHGGDFPDDMADYAVVPGYEPVFAAALLRRALVVLGVMLAVGLGL